MKAVVLLVVAVGCGLVAMLGVQQVLSGNKSEEVKTAKVLVATAEIVPGTPLHEENTIFKELPLESIPEGAVTDPTEIVEKSLKSTAVPGEFIMLAKLTTDLGASSEIPKGMRVVTTSVNLTKTHSGMIRPGDRVDILLSYKVRDADRGMMAKTTPILEFIEVFATDSIMASQDQGDSSEINAKNLSFLVTPDQALILNLAESKGDLNLALRHKHDDQQVGSAPIDEKWLEEVGSSSFGKEHVEGDGNPGPMLSGTGEKNDVRDAIKDELTQPETQAAEEVAVAPVVEEIPTWKVVIYSGKDVLEQEVPLPLDENGLTEEQVAKAEAEAAKAEEEAALAEREAQLAEREAELDAREAEMNKPAAAVETPAKKDEATKTKTLEAIVAPEPTEVLNRSATEEEEQAEEKTEVKTEAVKKDTDKKAWDGAVKRFLTGA
ncbi:MAG: Flp pilus assembly protein CpaB [Planctomycetaceae bacterium]|nr:Flp pilus assembly protein CpaB [Planctomycetaceae bacterium]MBT6158277.1 Flp pilus assembly protein CpaB [Planctomycetaceae bacterium]MBT6483957.1 Flp pilus assembly protein CpaB [Planctomycetaceae bacterium]MBT6493990.1 Flp pilus assembly protein CpaB [Planctomycetaceae bacterium]